MRLKLNKLAQIIGGELRGDANKISLGVSTDSRTLKKGEVFFALKGERFDGHKFLKEAERKGACAGVVKRGYPASSVKNLPLIYVSDPLFALGELARYWRAKMPVKVVAITGSVGKTTTKELCKLVLSQEFKVLTSPGNYNNLIGVPLTIFQLKPSHQILILELATNSPGEIARLSDISQPEVGIITRIAGVHLEGLKDLDGVEKEKRALVSALGSRGCFIFNFTDLRLWRIAMGFAGKKIGFGLRGKKPVFADLFITALPSRLIEKDGIFWQSFKLKIASGSKKPQVYPAKIQGAGKHLLENALSAIACGLALGISPKKAVRALEKFTPLSGRGKLEKISERLWLLDESYNANPQSMSRALETLELYARKLGLRKVLVLGDMKELGDWEKQAHIQLGRELANSGFDRLFYLGEAQRWLAEGLKKRDLSRFYPAQSLKELKSILEPELALGGIFLVKASHIVGLGKVAEWIRERSNAL